MDRILHISGVGDDFDETIGVTRLFEAASFGGNRMKQKVASRK